MNKQKLNRLSVSEGINMKRIKSSGLTLALLAGMSVHAVAGGFPLKNSTINDDLNTRMTARINAMNERLSAKVTAKIERILKAGRVQEAQVLTQPRGAAIAPVVETEKSVYDLEKNRS